MVLVIVIINKCLRFLYQLTMPFLLPTNSCLHRQGRMRLLQGFWVFWATADGRCLVVDAGSEKFLSRWFVWIIIILCAHLAKKLVDEIDWILLPSWQVCVLLLLPCRGRLSSPCRWCWLLPPLTGITRLFHLFSANFRVNYNHLLLRIGPHWRGSCICSISCGSRLLNFRGWWYSLG